MAFRLHEALGTQNERYFVAATPPAHSLACLRIDDPVTAAAARLATGVGGLAPHRRVSHPLDDKQSFMMSSHHHSPLTSLAWSHHATTPVSGNGQMRRFTSAAYVQRFASVHGVMQYLFRVGRHLLRSRHHRVLRRQAFVEWDAATCAC